LAKIAVELTEALAQRSRSGAPGRATARQLAQGDGWTVADVLCTSGPSDRPFEEEHAQISIAVVLAGSFQYHRSRHRELMTPGSLLLGSAGQNFECRHDHGTGDRCLSFSYSPDYFERLASDAGAHGVRNSFRVPRLPPLRVVAALAAQASAGLTGSMVSWEEIGMELAFHAVQLAEGLSPRTFEATPSTLARVTRIVRMIEQSPMAKLSLTRLAAGARLSPYHFLRVFQQTIGLTPHQYVLRTRLREAARRLLSEPDKILDIAMDCGFGDVSNFNHAFRAEFQVSPRQFRQHVDSRSVRSKRSDCQVVVSAYSSKPGDRRMRSTIPFSSSMCRSI
jgi:AraC-like DNA-binding protein